MFGKNLIRLNLYTAYSLYLEILDFFYKSCPFSKPPISLVIQVKDQKKMVIIIYTLYVLTGLVKANTLDWKHFCASSATVTVKRW